MNPLPHQGMHRVHRLNSNGRAQLVIDALQMCPYTGQYSTLAAAPDTSQLFA